MEKTRLKRKRIFLVLGGAALILAVLAVFLWLLFPKPERATTQEQSDTVYARGSQFATEQGLYFRRSDGRMDFLDFETGRQVPLCGKASCGHTEQENCDAYIAYTDQGYEYSLGSFIAYQKHLYLFCRENFVTILVEADLDGSNRKKLAQMEYFTPIDIFASRGKLFFTCQWINMEQGAFSGHSSDGSVTFEFDLVSGQCKPIVNSEKSNDIYTWIGGTDGTTLYYGVNPTTENEEIKQKCGLYRYQIEDGTSEKIADADKLAEWGNFRIWEDFLYYAKEQADKTSQVIELDLLTNQERIIAQHEGKLELRGPYNSLLNLLFVTDDDKREILQEWDYDLVANQKLESSWPKDEVKGISIFGAAPNGYMITVLSLEDIICEAYITKENYNKRNLDFIKFERS